MLMRLRLLIVLLEINDILYHFTPLTVQGKHPSEVSSIVVYSVDFIALGLIPFVTNVLS